MAGVEFEVPAPGVGRVRCRVQGSERLAVPLLPSGEGTPFPVFAADGDDRQHHPAVPHLFAVTRAAARALYSARYRGR